MNEKSQLLDKFSGWNRFVLQIAKMEWQTPIEEGKWTIHEIVSHIAVRRRYIFERVCGRKIYGQILSARFYLA
ncbi:hypothetical protein ABEX25_07515 [Paenibacillus thiaminolyticus]|uniref:hypothetical protein n=1 Tax=Paenibacillus thiaminolyticus TaxID=49283 RepID=UPI003D2AAFFD